jgi:hypothetical protein
MNSKARWLQDPPRPEGADGPSVIALDGGGSFRTAGSPLRPPGQAGALLSSNTLIAVIYGGLGPMGLLIDLLVCMLIGSLVGASVRVLAGGWGRDLSKAQVNIKCGGLDTRAVYLGSNRGEAPGRCSCTIELPESGTETSAGSVLFFTLADRTTTPRRTRRGKRTRTSRRSGRRRRVTTKTVPKGSGNRSTSRRESPTGRGTAKDRRSAGSRAVIVAVAVSTRATPRSPALRATSETPESPHSSRTYEASPLT